MGGGLGGRAHPVQAVDAGAELSRLVLLGGERLLAQGAKEMPITDPRMTRFWITLDEAVDLVLYALEHTEGGEVFVPKIPSMKVVDLADAMAQGIPTVEVGIRPGEKLHEALLTEDEARHSVDAGDVYVVLPEHPWWGMGGAWEGATPLPEGFAYTSDNNDDWLSADQLTALLA